MTNPYSSITVALLGRPNVGKSTVFNRLIGRKVALVKDIAGVTRDVLRGQIANTSHPIAIADMGGVGFTSDNGFSSEVSAHSLAAVQQASIVAVVVDSAAGLLPEDETLVAWLRKTGKPSLLIVNKVDTAGHHARVGEFYRLGLEPIFPVSAEHGIGFSELVAFLEQMAAEQTDLTAASATVAAETEISDEEAEQISEADQAPIPLRYKLGHFAVVGRPNVGKSSLVNRLIGSEKLLTSAEAGTTLDPTDSALSWEGEQLVLIDTAGIRRKRSIDAPLERLAVGRSFDSMDRASVVILVLDGSQRPSEQDVRLAAMSQEKGKGLVIAVNKWDLVENPVWKERYRKAIAVDMPFARHVPVVPISAKTGLGVSRLIQATLKVQEQWQRRITTGQLNRFFQEVVAFHPPPIRGKHRPHLYYVSQPMTEPPTFVFTSSHGREIPNSYRRYLENALRSRYGFEGCPLWLKFRDRGKKSDAAAAK